MNQFYSFIKRYLGFSSGEASGFVVLIIIILIFISLPLVYRLIPENEPTITDHQKLDSLQKELLARIDHKKEASEYHSSDFESNYDQFPNGKSDYSPRKLFNFDPNSISAEGFEALGLPQFIAERIVKYRNAGGHFETKEDLRKIYGLLPATYSKLEPYIKISENSTSKNKFENTANSTQNLSLAEPNSKNSSTNSFAKKPIAFDLNKADTTVLMNIKGIGSKLSARIIKVRELYGGFYSIDQINEVYGLEPAVLEEILKYAYIKNPILRKIKINEATEIKHPNIKPYIAKAIINFRAQHGKFNSIDDLSKIKILDTATLEKIRPYLEF